MAYPRSMKSSKHNDDDNHAEQQQPSGEATTLPSPGAKPTQSAKRLIAAQAAFEEAGMDFVSLVAESNRLEEFMKNKDQPVAEHDRSNKIIYPELRLTDIVFGRGTHSAKHPGNILFRHIVVKNQRYYLQLLEKEDQKRAIDIMIAYFETKFGTRYVEPCSSLNTTRGKNGQYQSVEYPRIVEKFFNLFRETREKWCSAIVSHAKAMNVHDGVGGGGGDGDDETMMMTPNEIKASVNAKKARRRADDFDGGEDEEEQDARHNSAARKRSPRRASPSKSIAESSSMHDSEAEDDEHGAHFSKASRRERARMDRNKHLEEEQPTVLPELENVRKHLEDDGISLERFLFEARIERLRKKYKPSKLSTTKWYPHHVPTYNTLAPCDILIGRGHNIQMHPGNVLLRNVLGINHQYYVTLKKHERDPAADALIAYFELKGIHFVEERPKEKGVFQAISYVRVAEKFKSCMRTGIVAFREAKKADTADESVAEEPPAPVRHPTKAITTSTAATATAKKPPVAPVQPPTPTSHNPSARFVEEMFAADKALKAKKTSLVDFLSGCKLNDLMDETSVSKASTMKSIRHELREFEAPQTLDVIFGRGHQHNRHPGNWLFRQVVGMNQDFYRDRIPRYRKMEAADALLACFETLGVHFLEMLDTDTYVEVEYGRIVEKFKQGLRERLLQKYLLSLSDAAFLSGSKTSMAKLLSVPKKPTPTLDQSQISSYQNKKRTYVEIDSQSDDDDDDDDSDNDLGYGKPQKMSAKVTPDVNKTGGSKRSKSADYIVKKNPEDFLRVSHFVMNFEDDSDEEVDEEDLGRSLHTIRYAIRTSTPKSTFSKDHAPGRSHHIDKELEKLMQIYRPSPSSNFGTGTKTPCPVFF